jgi:hypothetical protein
MLERPRVEAPPQLAGLLREFALTDAARVCADPAGAYANCLAVSVRCAEWLRARGIECGLLRLAASRAPFPHASGRWSSCDPRELSHWTVSAGSWSIDWSARQFEPEADWPDVRRVDSLADRWEVAAVWACDRCPELVADPRHIEFSPRDLERAHRAVGLATGGRGPFPDRRHDSTPGLVSPCSCDAAPSAGPQS